MNLSLLALFIAAFAFGTTEFVVAGVLPDVAAGLGVSVPTAGYLVSGYALGVAIGGPLLTIATRRVPRKTLLVALLGLFSLGQLACALAPDFASMMIVRFLVAIGHGTFFGVAMVVAVGLVAPGQRGRAVSIVLAGLTVSNVVGVPLGSAIGQAFGWRATFWAMLALGVVASLAMVWLLPRAIGGGGPSAGLLREVRVLGRQQVWTSLIVMLMLMIAQFVPFTFIAPLLSEVTGLDPATIPWVLLLNGAGATLGVYAGGRLADWKLMPSLLSLLAIQAVVLALMYLASPYPLAIVVVVTVWGCLNFAIGTPLQTRILTWTTDAPNLAASLIPAGFNVGIAFAASFGAAMLTAGFGYGDLPLFGVAAMVVAVLVAATSWTWERARGSRPPRVATVQ